MDQFSRQPVNPQSGQNSNQEPNESFSEMAEVTVKQPGVIGKLLIASLIVVSVAITAFVGYAVVNNMGRTDHVAASEYQAVFLSDGQIYFGKLSDVDKRYAVLEDIYYLRVQDETEPLQQADNSAQTPAVTLVKLGDEIHGPRDKMVINSDQILFWENLKPDGEVSKAIAQFKANGGLPVDTTTQELPATPSTEE